MHVVTKSAKKGRRDAELMHVVARSAKKGRCDAGLMHVVARRAKDGRCDAEDAADEIRRDRKNGPLATTTPGCKATLNENKKCAPYAWPPHLNRLLGEHTSG